MPSLNIPGGFGLGAIRLNLTGDPQPMYVTFGVGPDVGGTDDPVQVANTLLGAFQADFGIWMSSAYQIASCEVRYHTALEAPDDPLHIAVSTASAVAGGRSEPPMPQNCAVLVHKRTASAGRRNRGRFYLPGINEQAVDGTGRLIAGDLLTGLITQAGEFLGDYATGGVGNLYLLHSDPVGVEGPGAPTQITALQVDPIIATQRRRLR